MHKHTHTSQIPHIHTPIHYKFHIIHKHTLNVTQHANTHILNNSIYAQNNTLKNPNIHTTTHIKSHKYTHTH